MLRWDVLFFIFFCFLRLYTTYAIVLFFLFAEIFFFYYF